MTDEKGDGRQHGRCHVRHVFSLGFHGMHLDYSPPIVYNRNIRRTYARYQAVVNGRKEIEYGRY